MSERQAWAALVLVVVALERHLHHQGKPLLTHAVHRSPVARMAVAVVALHLLDHKRRLPVDAVSTLGRYVLR